MAESEKSKISLCYECAVCNEIIDHYLVGGGVRHFKRPEERPFLRAERERVTCLFGGLTRRHDELILAAGRGMGYKADRIPVPTKEDYQTGREYCDPGMCNPAYFTIGALINYLKRLRDVEGMTPAEIIRDYVFVTAGSCGPCRFGMYEAQYRLALRNSGFDGFRVLLFQQKGGLLQSGEESGLELNAEFAVMFLTSLMIGDVLNMLACQIRPYEVEPGQTDRVLDEVFDHIREGHHHWHRKTFRAGAGDGAGFLSAAAARLLSRYMPGVDAPRVQRILAQVCGPYYRRLLEESAAIIDRSITVDFTRPKPQCKVTGEFWAKMTEGDGNFGMFSFLESHGAEVLIEPLMTWVNYLTANAEINHRERCLLDEPWNRVWRGVGGWGMPRVRQALAYHWRLLLLRLARRMLNREYERFRKALGGTTPRQVGQAELRRLAAPFINPKITGGEGHLDVGETIYYSNHRLADLIVSLKPFGCMPSTQSDGAQAAVLAAYPEILFVPVETSGEGDVNAYSRVQMALGEAKERCRREFEACVAETGYAIEALRRYCSEHAELRRPLQRIPRREGIAGRAANFVLYVAERMDKDPAWFALKAGPPRAADPVRMDARRAPAEAGGALGVETAVNRRFDPEG